MSALVGSAVITVVLGVLLAANHIVGFERAVLFGIALIFTAVLDVVTIIDR